MRMTYLDCKGIWLASAAALAPAALTQPAAAQPPGTRIAALTDQAPPASKTTTPATPAAVPFTPPARPIILTHILRRVLHDGQQIVVTRRYAAQFVPNGKGFMLTGELIDAHVDAPPAVGLLADIERMRPDSLLPLRLDRDGQIEGEPVTNDPETMRAATTAALRLVAAAPIAADSKQQSAALISQLLAAPGNLGKLPVDLFAPLRAEHQDQHAVDLPGGMTGTVTISTHVDGWHPGSLPRSVERTINTVIGGTERISSEMWSFAPGQAQ